MPTPCVATLRRFDALGWELWLVPALAAAAGWAVLASTGADVLMLRGLVFVGGPLLLLSGLHARLGGYLHAPARHRLLPLPLSPRLHWSAAAGPHRRGLLWTGAWGLGAVAGAVATAGLPTLAAAGVLADFAWFWLLAAALEPVIPAAGAWLGRRFDEDRPERLWQSKLGGGWTIPEAVVHLYAPALGLGLAALLAMPGQLWLDRWIDGETSPPVLAGVGLAALPLAAILGLLARRLYDRGLFGAVPWVHEATRTLAGPPVPEDVPGWLLSGRDPMRHLMIRQFWRTTPVPGLRLWTLLGGAIWMALAADPSIPAMAILLALSAVWFVPGARVHALGPVRARMAAALPLPPAARAGRSWTAWALLSSPVVASVGLVVVAWSLG